MPAQKTLVDKESSVGKNRAPLYTSLVIITAVILSYFFIPDVQQALNEAFWVLTSGNEQKINRWVGQFGVWGPIVIILVIVLQMFIVVIPLPVIIVVTILAYGVILGSIIAITGMLTASTVGYFVGAYLGPLFVAKLLGTSAKNKVTKAVDRYGFWAVAVIRLNPFISVVGGMLGMKYWKFIAATIVGIVPLTVVFAISVTYPKHIEYILLGVALVSLTLFMVYKWWGKKLKNSV